MTLESGGCTGTYLCGVYRVAVIRLSFLLVISFSSLISLLTWCYYYLPVTDEEMESQRHCHCC